MENIKIKQRTNWKSRILNTLQEIGKSLQFPIAILPFAAILNRFGALGLSYTSNTTPDGVLHITNHIGYWISFIIQKPGGVIFDNLPLIFAIGIAFGLAKDHRGEVALVGAAIYLVISAMLGEHGIGNMIYDKVLTFKAADGNFSKLLYVENYKGDVLQNGKFVLSIGVLGGIVSGILASVLYNKYKEIKLPKALSFFGGRRFVPMIGLACAVPVALAFAIIWPWLQYVLMLMGKQVADPSKASVAIPGTMLYGFLNRLLLPFGLHQILNTFFWFQLPIQGNHIDPISGSSDGIIHWDYGDINAFTAKNENAGLFQSGFFPVMMGGIPAIALAMIMSAKKEKRNEVAGFLGGVAVVAIVSGITEPIEFSFVFLAPALLLVHASLTAIFVGITTAMRIQVGFGFSAGIIDYLVSFPQAWGFSQHHGGIWKVISNPLMIIPLTAICAFVYYSVFMILIKKLNVMTPGREEEGVEVEEQTSSSKQNSTSYDQSNKYAKQAKMIFDAIGADNLVSIDNCATRLRLIVKDNQNIDKALIKQSGAFGIKQLGTEALQIVIGPDVEHVVNELKKISN
ncbi:PTS transporter subunit EIIC [Spiroplasma endosymbiont of Crioceris asparagi]|uniref:PTS transporter subunit EIIC n=1 Tax=Spiroplasma endosymbiont of Crioceris asparagi TaxID=3066286 RepID=UPI0030CDE90F